MEKEGTVSTIESMLALRGVSRRDFMKLCGVVAVAAGLSELGAPKVAQALETSVIGATKGNLYPVIWMEGASCTGCTEAFAGLQTPTAASIVLDMISLNYSETLAAGAGWAVEEAKKQTIEAGNYILIYEGAMAEGWGGQALRIANEPGSVSLLEAAKSANAIIALGSCAVNGGWMGAHPNPPQVLGVQQFLAKNGVTEVPIINVPGCPANPEWLVALLVDVVLMDNTIPKLNSENKPAEIFDQTVHDNCERRGHFENGEFVYRFGSEEEAKGYCLYAMGCRGPQTKANCGIVQWDNRRSWCIHSGAPCVGCCEADPNDPGHNWVEVNTPFFRRHRDLRIGEWMVQPGTIALGITGILAAVLIVHGFGMKAAGRTGKGAAFEKVRKWDEKHPNKSIGVYQNADTIEGTPSVSQADIKDTKDTSSDQEGR